MGSPRALAHVHTRETVSQPRWPQASTSMLYRAAAWALVTTATVGTGLASTFRSTAGG